MKGEKKEKIIRRLMKEHGLTRKEAEGLLEYLEESVKKFKNEFALEEVDENSEDGEIISSVENAFIYLIVASGVLVFLKKLFNKRRKREEAEEWLV